MAVFPFSNCILSHRTTSRPFIIIPTRTTDHYLIYLQACVLSSFNSFSFLRTSTSPRFYAQLLWYQWFNFQRVQSATMTIQRYWDGKMTGAWESEIRWLLSSLMMIKFIYIFYCIKQMSTSTTNKVHNLVLWPETTVVLVNIRICRGACDMNTANHFMELTHNHLTLWQPAIRYRVAGETNICEILIVILSLLTHSQSCYCCGIELYPSQRARGWAHPQVIVAGDAFLK